MKQNEAEKQEVIILDRQKNIIGKLKRQKIYKHNGKQGQIEDGREVFKYGDVWIYYARKEVKNSVE